MYYRVAIRREGDHQGQSPLWKWYSTALGSLNSVLFFFHYYHALPLDRLRVFASSSREELKEQLARENKELGPTSVTAAQFLQERRIGSPEGAWAAARRSTQGIEPTASFAVPSEPSLNERSKGAHALEERGRSSPEKRRGELERGAGGDYDTAYRFTLPTSMPQVLAWMKLLARVQRGELQP